MAYEYLDSLKTAWAVTSDDTNFPRKLLLYHNHHLPPGSDQLSEEDIERLRPLMLSAINSKEAEAMLEQPIGAPNYATYNDTGTPRGTAPEVGTNEGLLKTILLKMRYVSPGTIERFLENYRLNEEDFERRPETLLQFMRHMFGPGQGEAAFNVFKTTQGKYVDAGMASGSFNQGGMDPMMMAMMMGGGNMSAMLPMLMQQGGGKVDPMIMMMLNQQSQREQQKKDQQDMMDKAMQLAMLKMVGSNMEDRNPMNPYMMGGGMGMPGWQIQEVMDSNGKVTGRTLVPATPGMGMQNQSNPVVEIVLKNALERETMLMQQSMNSNKPITDLFMSMIGNFKTNSDPVAQLGMLRQSFPELFERKTDQGNMNLDVYKLKFDTDLAMMAQKIELRKMDHQWKMEQIDRESQNDNAKQWMQMIETFGEKLGAPIATAVLGGMSGGPGGPMGAPGGPPGPGGMPGMMPGMSTQTVPTGPPPGPPPAPKPDPMMQSIISTPNPGPDPAILQVAVQQEQQTRQLQSVMLAMQQEIERLRSDNNKMNSRLQGGQQRKTVDPNTIKKLPSSTLKEALIEFNHEQARSEEVGRLLQSELANRELSGREDEEEEQEDEQQEVTAAQAAGALDEEDKDEIVQEAIEEEEMGPSEGVSTKGISTGDANNALDADNASLPSEIKDHYDSYEKTAKDIENLDTEID